LNKCWSARFYRNACLEAAHATPHSAVAEQAVRMADEWHEFAIQVGRDSEMIASSQRLIAEADALLVRR